LWFVPRYDRLRESVGLPLHAGEETPNPRKGGGGGGGLDIASAKNVCL